MAKQPYFSQTGQHIIGIFQTAATTIPYAKAKLSWPLVQIIAKPNTSKRMLEI
jgi:hypothetical protein